MRRMTISLVLKFNDLPSGLTAEGYAALLKHTIERSINPSFKTVVTVTKAKEWKRKGKKTNG